MTQLSETEIRNAEQACAALAVEYAEIVDAREFSRFREIFAEDAAFTRPTGPQEAVRGVENIAALFETFPRNRVTQHLICNVRVQVETADTARGTCRVLLYTSEISEPETPEGRKASSKQLIGTYQDRYVRTKSGWRFAERRGSLLLYT